MALSAIFGVVREEVAEGHRKLKSDKSDVGNGGTSHMERRGVG